MDNAKTQLSVLFVCLGNICRSPTAEGVLRHQLADAGLSSQVRVDSAGTGAWHAGNPPDPRAQAAAKKRGIDISTLRARQVVAGDFEQFDYILAMDEDNKAALLQQCPIGEEQRIALLLDCQPSDSRSLSLKEVPDPYYGDSQGGSGDGFELVLDLVESACNGLLADIQRKTQEPG